MTSEPTDLPRRYKTVQSCLERSIMLHSGAPPSHFTKCGGCSTDFGVFMEYGRNMDAKKKLLSLFIARSALTTH